MNDLSLAYASYWRNSLADAESGHGGLSRRDVSHFSEIPLAHFSTGLMPTKIVEAYFEGEPDHIKAVDVVIRPQVYLARLEHGQQRRNNIPEIVTPLVTPGMLTRKGRLYPSARTVVPRDLLEPLERGSFTIGTVAAQDTFLTTESVPGISDDEEEKGPIPDGYFNERWKIYQRACERMLSQVCGGSLAGSKAFESADYAYLLKKASVTGASKHVLALYDHIRRRKPVAALFDRYASDVIDPVEPCLPAHALFAARLGHAGDAYSLAPAQRDALSHLLAARDGEILAVNGPPGTGKTTLLLSVVASVWAKAAIEETEPPVILAASTNNQAVTNIIDAFGRDFASGSGPFAGRWLPRLKSFGAYFPSVTKEAEAAKKYQTRRFFDEVESQEYVAAAEAHYLKAATAAFPDLTQPQLRSVVGRVHQSLSAEARKLTVIETAWNALIESRKAVRDELGEDPRATAAERLHRREQLATEKRACESLTEHWDAHLTAEPIFYSLFAWLPPVARKRLRIARAVLRPRWSNHIPQPEWQTIDEIEPTLAELVKQSRDALDAQEVLVQRALAVLDRQQHCQQDWLRALAPLADSGVGPDATLADVDAVADKHIRFPIFLLTTHYWEGIWLLEMQELLPSILDEKRRRGREALQKRWRRRMKLTPCVVSTFYMLPNEMKVARHESGGFVDDYLYQFADLLVVDEAGQVLPDVAGASFSLARKALVIGDTLQLEPMWNAGPVDVGNLVDAKLIPENDNDRSYDRLNDLGKTISKGSVMRIAQCATRYHAEPDLPRGLFLLEHRRCFDEIIRYSNELCYQRKLQPQRGMKAGCDSLPAMGYLHVDGICQSRGSAGSRFNLLEAEVIAAWLAERRKELETIYQKPLTEIVGIVTPFAAQVQALERACVKAGIKAGSEEREMTVGTVHSLQGAERLVVILSPVYSKHSDGPFIDKRASMLNVAVSRAKNSFLVFGDMDTFELAPRRSPRGQLATLLFGHDAQELHFEHRQRSDLATLRTGISHLRDAREHDAFLSNVLATAAREVHIVTPWIRLDCIEQTGAMGSMAAAVRRGVKVRVYTDPGSNARSGGGLQTTVKELRTRKIEAVLVWKVHSKIVIGDENVYCVGSFNWFSARREPDFERHETSLVYRGPDLAKEVEVVKESLERRVARFPH